MYVVHGLRIAALLVDLLGEHACSSACTAVRSRVEFQASSAGRLACGVAKLAEEDPSMMLHCILAASYSSAATTTIERLSSHLTDDVCQTCTLFGYWPAGRPVAAALVRPGFFPPARLAGRRRNHDALPEKKAEEKLDARACIFTFLGIDRSQE